MKYLRIAVLVLGMALMIGSAGLFARNEMRSLETRNWPRAEGRITDSRVDILHRQEVGNEGDFMPHVRYDYTVNGRTYHGDTLWLDERRSFGSANVAARELAFLETGTETEVIYNPQDPREAALMIDKPTWRYFFLALLGGLLGWLGWLGWQLRKLQPRPQPMPQPGQQPQPQAMAQAQLQAQMQPQAQAPLQVQPPAPADGRIHSSVRPAPSS